MAHVRKCGQDQSVKAVGEYGNEGALENVEHRELSPNSCSRLTSTYYMLLLLVHNAVTPSLSPLLLPELRRGQRI